MKKKNGFTLVEVLVSLILVSIVMATLISTLIKVKDAYNIVSNNSDISIYSATMSRVLNNEIAQNEGIRFINCDNTGQVCNLVLGNNQKRKLELIIFDAGDCLQTAKSPDNISYCAKKKRYSTLKYYNTTNATNPELLYIKSLTMYLSDYIGTEKEKRGLSGYSFSYMIPIENEYVISGITYKIASVSIGIYDGNDINDSTFNVRLSSSARLDSSRASSGDSFTLTLNNNLGYIPSDADFVNPVVNSSSITCKYLDNDGNVVSGTTCVVEKITEKYNLGFYIDDDNTSVLINSITPPQVISDTKIFKFLGYYYNEVQIIDEDGQIKVGSTFFEEKGKNYELLAHWDEI